MVVMYGNGETKSWNFICSLSNGSKIPEWLRTMVWIWFSQSLSFRFMIHTHLLLIKELRLLRWFQCCGVLLCSVQVTSPASFPKSWYFLELSLRRFWCFEHKTIPNTMTVWFHTTHHDTINGLSGRGQSLDVWFLNSTQTEGASILLNSDWTNSDHLTPSALVWNWKRYQPHLSSPSSHT